MPSVSAGIGGTRCAAMDSLSEGSCCELELGSSSSEPLPPEEQEQLGEPSAPGHQGRLGDSTSPSCLSAAMSDADGDAQREGSDGCPSESLSDGQGGAVADKKGSRLKTLCPEFPMTKTAVRAYQYALLFRNLIIICLCIIISQGQ